MSLDPNAGSARRAQRFDSTALIPLSHESAVEVELLDGPNMSEITSV
jgi:hypothetical protein